MDTYDVLYYKGFPTRTQIPPECQQQISYYALVSSSVPVTRFFFFFWLKSNYQWGWQDFILYLHFSNKKHIFLITLRLRQEALKGKTYPGRGQNEKIDKRCLPKGVMGSSQVLTDEIFHLRCAEGYFGQPSVPGGSCQPCQCNDNLDFSIPGSCDSLSGSCLICKPGTTGRYCELCADGYFGDAVDAKNCQRKS